MFIIIVVMAGIVLFTALTVGILPLYETFHSNNSQIIANEIATIQKAVNDKASDDIGDFYQNGYAYPSSVTNARMNVNAQEYRHLSFINYERYKHIESNFKYKDIGRAGESVYSKRFAIWFESPFGNFLGEDYTKAAFNKCRVSNAETEGVMEAQEWCGDTKSLWGKLESHTGHFNLIQSEQHRLYRLSRKFYRYYEAVGSFSEFGVRTDSLAKLVAPAAVPSLNASNCVGVYYFKDIPLGCQDMFNSWGKAIYLHSLNEDHIALTNSLGIELVQPNATIKKYVGLAEDINIGELMRAAP